MSGRRIDVTEWNRLCCDFLVTQAILKGIGISVHVSSDYNDDHVEISVHGVPSAYLDKAINEVIDAAL